MLLLIKNLLFTILAPGTVAVFGAWPIGVYGAGFHLFVVLYEEPHLRKVFGPAYQRYCETVGRWLPQRLSSHPPHPSH